MRKITRFMFIGCFLLVCNVLFSSSENEVPKIIKHPKPATADEGGEVAFNVSVRGKPVPSAEVFKNDVLVDYVDHDGIYYEWYHFKFDGTNLIFKIFDVKTSDEGDYRFTFKNKVGEASSTVPLEVIPSVWN